MKNTGEYLHNQSSSLFGSREGGAAGGGAAAGGAAAGGEAAGSAGNAGGSFTDSLRHASEQARSIAADKLQLASDYLKNKDGKGSQLVQDTRNAADQVAQDAQHHIENIGK